MPKTLRAVAVVLSMLSTPAIARADAVLDWNALAVETLVRTGQNPFAQARFSAVVQLAVFEAVNATTHQYAAYAPQGTYAGVVAPPGASPEAAAVQAAYRVLKTYFPLSVNPDLDAARAASLAAIPDGAAKDDGIVVGELAAAAMIALRQDDGASPPAVSPVGPAIPGIWQLTSPPGCAVTATGGSLYQWGSVTPFGVPAIEGFRPGPPPALTSNEFARDFTEVKTVGSVTSSARPADRSDVARFYQASSPTLLFNLAARQLAGVAGGSLTANARALALVAMAINDSLVASFSTKYFYNFWRPETAIRFVGDYGNRKVDPDPSYTPYISTPCFPSYPSNHASGSNAGAEMLRRLFGEGEHVLHIANPFNPAAAGLAYTYTTLNELVGDVDDARIYGGIHFRFDQEAGGRLGRAIATAVYKGNLRKID
jgi:hypothetical protein